MTDHTRGNVSIKEPVKKWTLHFTPWQINPWLRTETADLLMRPSKNSVYRPKGVQYDLITVQRISELKAFNEG